MQPTTQLLYTYLVSVVLFAFAGLHHYWDTYSMVELVIFRKLGHQPFWLALDVSSTERLGMEKASMEMNCKIASLAIKEHSLSRIMHTLLCD